jgi:hypothetical protein
VKATSTIKIGITMEFKLRSKPNIEKKARVTVSNCSKGEKNILGIS